jgi:anti-sigma B factor antagonist
MGRVEQEKLFLMSETFRTKITGDVLHISMNIPRLDATSAAAIKKELLLDLDPAVKRAEVEIGNVGFIDSSGIGVLLGIYRKLPGDDAEVTLLNVQPGVQSVLELLRLHRVFKVA